jgi:hypothetical protein
MMSVKYKEALDNRNTFAMDDTIEANDDCEVGCSETLQFVFRFSNDTILSC